MFDPATVSVIGSALGGAGSLVSAFSGGDSGGLSEGQKWIQAHPVLTRVNDAKAAGIHPLYALGTPGISQVPDGQSGSGSHMADVLSAVGDIAKRYGDTRQIEARQALADKMALEKHNQEILESQSRVAANQAEARRYSTEQLNGPALVNYQNRPGGPKTQPAQVFTDFLGNEIVVGQDTPAQEWSDQYGDIVESVEGFPRYLRDRIKSAVRHAREGRYVPGWFPGASYINR